MPLSLPDILVLWLLSSANWPITTSFSPHRGMRLSQIQRSTSLRALAKDDNIIQAYQRLGEKLLKGGRIDAPVVDVPPAPTPEVPPLEFDAATSLPALPPAIEDVGGKASQSVTNVVSETIQRAQQTYQGASQALTDSPRQPGMVPSFVEFIKDKLERARLPNDEITGWTIAKEKIALLQRNTFEFFEIPTDGNALFAPKGGAIIDLIHSEKFAWYMVAVLFILAVTQRRLGVEATRDDMNALVHSAERKAKDAADAANKAAQGAVQAMQMTEEVIAQKEALQAEKEVLNAEMEKLKNEIKDLKVQLNEKHIKASKAAADKATIEALEAEKAKLQGDLMQKSEEVEALKTQLKAKEIKASTAAATAAKIEALENENALLQESLQNMTEAIELLKSQLQESQRIASQATTEATTIEALQKENAELKAEVRRLAQVTEELRLLVEKQMEATTAAATAAATAAEESEPVDRFLVEKQMEATAAVTATATAALEASPTLSVAEESVTVERFNAEPAPTPPPAEDVVAVAPKRGRKASGKTTKTTKKTEVVVVVEDDWKSLSLSALKRKSVKDLADYLESKGVTTIDADGKPLKKSDLVDAVLSS